ncbi:MAG TPA: glycoside hydrolase family 88 protein [Tepidisphaeraceae bacterium]|nr:glycoside hydrolase family 88 protein [Tepidisphaeraceae bacterium]
MIVTRCQWTPLFVALLVMACGCARREGPSNTGEANAVRWSVRMADSTMARHPNPALMEDPEPEWRYSSSFAVHSIARLGVETGERKYIDYARRYMEPFIDDAGRIVTDTYDPRKYRLDDIVPGRVLLLLHQQTRDPRFLVGPRQLIEQLKTQPRTSDGGYWHKQIYPHQLWLDGIFMDCPFMVEFAARTNEPAWHDEAVRQILTIARHTHDPKTGLYYHGWDESRTQKWADPQTGRSQNFWGRAVGWYALGIIETLRTLPADHPRREEVLNVFGRLADAIARVQDADTGLWWQVLDQPKRQGNYLESSASSMFVYALAAGARLGYLDAKHADVARRGYRGIIEHFIEVDPATGHVSLKDTCQVAGLGGNPYRDGSYAYYISEPRVANDPKGVAPFILAAMEMEGR